MRLVAPRHVNRTVPVRPANVALRQREYLTPGEVEKLIKTARDGRYGHRDASLILVAYRHGLRAIELCDLEWSQVEWGRAATLHVRRVKNGKPAAHPIRGDELRALRELRRLSPTAPLSLRLSVAARSRLMRSIGWSSASANALASPFRFMLTCCAMPAATNSPMTAMTRGPSRTGSVIARSSIRRATLNSVRRVLKISGGIDRI
jgi:integrase